MNNENLPATQDDHAVGLEDFDQTDMVMPRLTIDHDNGLLVDSLSGKTYQSIECIVLGLVKGRVLWHEDPDFDGGPLCRSNDGKVGIPSHRPTAPFPWAAAQMNPADFPEGMGVLCESCPLAQWGSHPKNDVPWCTEQFKLPILMSVAGGFSPAVLTLQRSAIKSIRGYATSFGRTSTPMYTVWTTISLDLNKKGQRSYAVPKFAQGEETDEQAWDTFAEHFRRIRGFLVEGRAPQEESTPTAPQAVPVNLGQTAIPQTTQQAAPAPAPAPPAPAPAPEPAPAPAPEPAQAAPAPAPAPAPQAAPAQPAADPDFDSDIGF